MDLAQNLRFHVIFQCFPVFELALPNSWREVLQLIRGGPSCQAQFLGWLLPKCGSFLGYIRILDGKTFHFFLVKPSVDMEMAVKK